VVLQRYSDLFQELADLRSAAPPGNAGQVAPLSLDPVRLFGSFASHSAADPWPAPSRPEAEPAVVANRQALWQTVLQPLSTAQRQLLLPELHRKHL
jgi:hypothetical protein